jgi:hypothetical protein
VAGKIIADIIEAPFDSIKMNVANVTVLTANNSGLTYLPTGNVNINVGSTTSLSLGNVTVSNLITANGGIKFPATQVASADVNTLDDYEEGTWTPTVRGSTTSGTYTLTDITAYYTKIGNQVTAWCVFGFSAASGGSGIFLIEGLPFSYKALSQLAAPANATFLNTSASSSNGISILNGSSSVNTQLIPALTIDNAARELIGISGVSTSTTMLFCITYTVS